MQFDRFHGFTHRTVLLDSSSASEADRQPLNDAERQGLSLLADALELLAESLEGCLLGTGPDLLRLARLTDRANALAGALGISLSPPAHTPN